VGSSSAIVDFEDVTKVYASRLPWNQGLRAVSGVSFHVEPGEVLGLLGPNRAGKTTLVKILLSLCRPTSGRVLRLGHPVTDRRTLARIGYVHENPAFPRYLTATSLLDYYGALTLMPAAEIHVRRRRLLEQVGLADRAHEPIARFSKGMVQRLALAQALINAPELLVLDEPNEGLDLIGRSLVKDVVLDQRQSGRSVLLVTHVVAEAERLCDRIAVVVGGRLVYCGPPSGLTHKAEAGRGPTLEHALRGLYGVSAA
jgi:ABC-2 type transport system ATP-binding protein